MRLILASQIIPFWENCFMRPNKEKLLLNLLLGTGAYLLYSLRDRLGIGDLSDGAQESYETASRRVRRASDALRGQDRYTLTTGAALLVGVGVGVGIGMLVAPASGEKTRADISDKVKDFSDKVRERSARQEPQGATGTYGE
jgi:YtxH-like protein